MQKLRRRTLQAVGTLFLCGLVFAGIRYLPFGQTDADRYFDPPETRALQEDAAFPDQLVVADVAIHLHDELRENAFGHEEIVFELQDEIP